MFERFLIMLENYKDILTVQELMTIIPIGRNGMYKLLMTNKIRHIRVGNKYLIPKQSVIDFFNTTD